MSSVFASAVSGMNAAIARVKNAATNIVNVSSTGRLPTQSGEEATSYYPTDIVTLSNDVGDNHLGVRVQTVLRANPYTVSYDPHSPDANADGLIAAPNVDLVSEIVDTMFAEIAYKANAKVIAAEKQVEKSLIDTLA